MIYINPEDKKIKDALDKHSKAIYCLVNKKIYGITYDCENKDYNNAPCLTCKQTSKLRTAVNVDIVSFLKINLKNIIVDKPIQLINRQNIFFEQFILGFNDLELDKYLKCKKKKEDERNFIEKDIFNRYDSIFTQIKNIFNYDVLTDTAKNYSAYNLSNNLDITTCTYCNRLYTKTVINPNKITRPEFDHWYSKSKYPLLALSFHNLIPSCHVCNSSVKGTTDLSLDEHFHPYVDTEKIINDEIKFSYYNKSLDTYGFTMTHSSSKAKNTINAFKIKEIYKTHEDEIIDLRKIRDTYSESYLQNLSTLYKGVISEEEIYRLAFGVYLEEAKFEKRPLSKMKKDILIELGIIKNGK